MKDIWTILIGIVVFVFMWFLPKLLGLDGWVELVFVIIELKIFDDIFFADKKENDK